MPISAATNATAGFVTPPDSPSWPSRLIELCSQMGSLQDPHAIELARGEIWRLFHLALSCYVRRHRATLGRVDDAHLEDIAATKALDLLRQVESHSWDVSGRANREIAAYVSTVARNGLVDCLRQSGREVPIPEDAGHGEGAELTEAATPMSDVVHAPESSVEREEFVRALRDCFDRLQQRSRLIWMFRVFYDMSSKEIAHHPEVGLKPGHVDVILQRVRDAVKKCLHAKGHGDSEIPPGAFAELWYAMRCASRPLETSP